MKNLVKVDFKSNFWFGIFLKGTLKKFLSFSVNEKSDDDLCISKTLC